MDNIRQNTSLMNEQSSQTFGEGLWSHLSSIVLFMVYLTTLSVAQIM
jgi:hypothetical protein